jgi:hypothetical protein
VSRQQGTRLVALNWTAIRRKKRASALGTPSHLTVWFSTASLPTGSAEGDSKSAAPCVCGRVQSALGVWRASAALLAWRRQRIDRVASGVADDERLSQTEQQRQL